METGWYEGLPEEERVCPVCNANTGESEYHAIISCSLYEDVREKPFTSAISCNDAFYHMSNNDNLPIYFIQKKTFYVYNVTRHLFTF